MNDSADRCHCTRVVVCDEYHMHRESCLVDARPDAACSTCKGSGVIPPFDASVPRISDVVAAIGAVPAEEWAKASLDVDATAAHMAEYAAEMWTREGITDEERAKRMALFQAAVAKLPAPTEPEATPATPAVDCSLCGVVHKDCLVVLRALLADMKVFGVYGSASQTKQQARALGALMVAFSATREAAQLADGAMRQTLDELAPACGHQPFVDTDPVRLLTHDCVPIVIESVKRLTGERDSARATLAEVLDAIQSSHKGSIGSIDNTYMCQIGVERAEQWRAVLAPLMACYDGARDAMLVSLAERDKDRRAYEQRVSELLESVDDQCKYIAGLHNERKAHAVLARLAEHGRYPTVHLGPPAESGSFIGWLTNPGTQVVRGHTFEDIVNQFAKLAGLDTSLPVPAEDAPSDSKDGDR